MSYNGRYVAHKLVAFCSREFVRPGSAPAFQFHGSLFVAGCFLKKKITGILLQVSSSSGKNCQVDTGNIFFSLLFLLIVLWTGLYPSRTITGKFTATKTVTNLTITTEKEGTADPIIVDVKSKISFTSDLLSSRIKLIIDGNTHHSEYYTGFMIDYPISVDPNTPTYYGYSYDYSDYGERFEYCSSGALSYDIIIDGVTVQRLANPLLNHHNKTYETDKYKITITVIEK